MAKPTNPVSSVAEVEALADAMPERWRLLVLLAAWCGLRRGELLALRRRDLDPLHCTVRVERTHVLMRNGSVLVGPSKTDAGRRVVAVPPHLAGALEEHLSDFVGPEADAPVFTGVKGGPLRPLVLQKAWERARASVGLDHLHLHDLRHAGNTWAAGMGASTRELMGRMGHASPAAALRYQHATADRDQAIADALSELAGRATVAKFDRARSGHADPSTRDHPNSQR